MDSMSSRYRFPVDLMLTVLLPVATLASVFALDAVQKAWVWWLHPTTAEWFIAASVATLATMMGASLLVFAKKRQYREGVFFRFGCAGMTERERRCYRWAFVLLVPALLTIWGLIFVSGMVK